LIQHQQRKTIMPSKRAATGAVKTLREFVKKCKEARGSHPTTAKKARKKKKSAGDPSWFGHKKGHKKAAKKGWRKRKAKSARDPKRYTSHKRKSAKRHTKKRKSSKRDPRRFGHRGGPKGGWRHTAGDPRRFGSRGLGRRRSAVGPWYMGRDPE
jgi:hypothetical protein